MNDMDNTDLILLVIIVCLVIISGNHLYGVCTRTPTENFGGRFSLKSINLTDQDYIQDVANIANEVGGYIGDIYLNLREASFDPVSQTASVPNWKPETEKDVQNVPLNAKIQIKGYLTTAIQMLNEKYPKEIINSSKWGITFTEKDNVIYVTYKANGIESTYIV